MVEEGEECEAAPGRPCESSCGSEGIQYCMDCRWEATCWVFGEIPCNGIDDDCDGLTDEGAPWCPLPPAPEMPSWVMIRDVSGTAWDDVWIVGQWRLVDGFCAPG